MNSISSIEPTSSSTSYLLPNDGDLEQAIISNNNFIDDRPQIYVIDVTGNRYSYGTIEREAYIPLGSDSAEVTYNEDLLHPVRYTTRRNRIPVRNNNNQEEEENDRDLIMVGNNKTSNKQQMTNISLIIKVKNTKQLYRIHIQY